MISALMLAFSTNVLDCIRCHKIYHLIRLNTICINTRIKENHTMKSLTTKKQTTKFSSANFQKMLSPSYIILRIQRLEGK